MIIVKFIGNLCPINYILGAAIVTRQKGLLCHGPTVMGGVEILGVTHHLCLL